MPLGVMGEMAVVEVLSVIGVWPLKASLSAHSPRPPKSPVANTVNRIPIDITRERQRYMSNSPAVSSTVYQGSHQSSRAQAAAVLDSSLLIESSGKLELPRGNETRSSPIMNPKLHEDALDVHFHCSDPDTQRGRDVRFCQISGLGWSRLGSVETRSSP